MFDSGLIRGESAAEEKCVAKDIFLFEELSLAGGGGRTGSAWVAQLVERVLGKDEVTSSILVVGF